MLTRALAALPNVLRTLRPWHFLMFQPGREPSWAVLPPVPPPPQPTPWLLSDDTPGTLATP